MNQEDLKARFMALDKEKVRLSAHREAREKEAIDASRTIAKARSIKKCADLDIAKTINLLCEIAGKQEILWEVMPEELQKEFHEKGLFLHVPPRTTRYGRKRTKSIPQF